VVPAAASLVSVADPNIGIESQADAPGNPQSKSPEKTLTHPKTRQLKHSQIQASRFKIKGLGKLHGRLPQ
jgi:hypothetical protein